MIGIKKIKNILYLLLLTLILIQDFIPIFGEAFKIVITGGLLLFSFVFLNRSNWKINQKTYFYWVLGILLYFYTSSMWAIRPILSYWLIIQALIPILVVTFSMFLYATDRDKVYHLLGVYYFAAIVMLLYLVFVLDFSAIAGNRVTAAINTDEESWNSNGIGLTFATGIYCGYLLIKRSSKVYRFCFILLSILMLYGILLTGSRKSLIILFIPIICFSAYNLKRNFFKVLVTVFISIIIAYYLIIKVPFFYDIIGVRMEDLFNILSNNTDGTEDTSRVLLIIYGWEWFLEHPLLGVGVNNYRALSNATIEFAGKNFYAHNNYIEILVGCGLIGFILYYSAHIYLLKQSLRLQSAASKWVISFLAITLFVDMAMVSYYDLMTHYFLIICFIVIFQERYFRYGTNK